MQTKVVLDNKIPYGNGILVGIENKKNWLEVAVTPEALNAPESLWFCFRLKFKNRPKTQNRLRLVIKYFYNSLGGLPAEKINPVTRIAKGDWQRLAAGKTVPLPDGRADAVWETNIIADSMDFAFCFPYGVPEMDEVVEKSKGYLKKDIIGISPEGRDIVRISNNYGDESAKKPGLYLVARQHSGETSGSWVLHGFLERLAESNTQNMTVWCLPLTNIDGVEKGYYGKDNFPTDINRAWGVPPMRYENLVFQRDIERWANRSQPLLALDFHSPGGSENEGVYCFLPKNDKETSDKMSSEWSERFKKSIPSEFTSDQFGKVANYASRWESPSFSYYKFMNRFYKIPALSFEFPYSRSRERILEIKNYLEIGAAMADTVLETLKTITEST
ncbi:MAG: M14 family zinc carboxypeptidase [Victivallaceae bacterium]|jgi:hypothetical protein